MNILFVTKGSFGSNSATGQMLNNLFDGLSEIKVLQYSLMPRDNGYRQLISNVSEMQNVNYSVFCQIESVCNKKLLSSRKFKGVWAVIKRACDFLDGLTPPHLSNIEIRGIKAFAPDVIYSLASDTKVLRICNLLSSRLNIPIVLHNMDDFYNMKYGNRSIIRRIANHYLQREYKKAYSHSKMSLAIGPKMQNEYSSTFNIPFDWVMNCVPDTASFPHYEPKDNISLIIFSGGLHGGRAETLAQIAKIIEGRDLKLEIFTSSMDRMNYNYLFSSFVNTKLLEYVKKEDMFTNLSRADVLLHVESYFPRYTMYFRLSMSTKIPEYMSVCRPILCVGPSGIATVDFIKEKKVGLVVNDISEFEESISLISSVAARVELVNNSIQIVSKDFFRSKMQIKLVNVIKQNLL